jgi:2OG-Fe(II) oxygenase superfamily
MTDDLSQEDHSTAEQVDAATQLVRIQRGHVVQVFPNVKAPPHQTADRYSPCAMKGLAVKPRAGSAVAFWSLQTDGRLDSGSLHGGCPVIRGTKWSATKWWGLLVYFCIALEAPLTWGVS